MRRKWIGLTLAAIASVGSFGCVGRVAHNLPPSPRLLEPGPGVGGPGPGVITPASAVMPMGPMGAGGAMGAMGGGAYGPCNGAGGGIGAAGALVGVGTGIGTSQIAFLGVEGAEVAWDVSGQGMFDSSPLVMPGRQNFSQGAIYRLKLTNIPDRPGVELYPTLEVAPATPRTDAYLAHTPIPIQFTDEDLDQVLSGNFVTKVIYLPDPEFQDLAMAGVETLVSTRLDPGVDPIVEADRRGSILAILRIGNLDLQLPGQMVAMGGGVQQAQYVEGCPVDGDGGASPMGPRGVPTAFAPQVAPPNLISGVNGPQYGMPITGTPIGLPGPPHIPLGHQAGLVEHTMKNRTRVLMPPPVHKMKMTVKQRPGMNYPRPVNHVNVSEVNRAPLQACDGSLLQKLACKIGAHKNAAADECYDNCPQDYSSQEYSTQEYSPQYEQ
jgi:hypothetical protein